MGAGLSEQSHSRSHIEFADVPRDAVPAFLRSVHGGLAHVKGRFFPPGWWLIVPLPGDETSGTGHRRQSHPLDELPRPLTAVGSEP
ncbi:hypothetical protein STANM309S_03434 [Streptomyces tanashiensis]